MAKFAEAENELNKVLVCMKCKARNPKTSKRCRKCGAKDLRPKRKQTKGK